MKINGHYMNSQDLKTVEGQLPGGGESLSLRQSRRNTIGVPPTLIEGMKKPRRVRARA